MKQELVWVMFLACILCPLQNFAQKSKATNPKPIGASPKCAASPLKLALPCSTEPPKLACLPARRRFLHHPDIQRTQQLLALIEQAMP